MSVTQDQIKKIAKNLCKLPSEEVKLVNDVNDILKYVEMLNEVDTTGVEPTVSVVSKKMTSEKMYFQLILQLLSHYYNVLLKKSFLDRLLYEILCIKLLTDVARKKWKIGKTYRVYQLCSRS
jgi:aspartyl/glutamyl-tRNA(Asn/Gln) amidotransferase C subunit